MDQVKHEYQYIPRKIAIGFQEGACPLKCKKCWAFGKGKENHVRKMALDDAKKLIDEISVFAAGTSISIQPHVQAEPFANSDFMEIVEYCKFRDIRMHIVTNGILINEKWKKYITEELNERFQISFSLDAVTQETYEKVRGNYSLSQLEYAIRYILENRKCKELRTIVNYVEEEDNEKETAAFLDKWKDLADAVSIGTCLDSERKIPEKYRKGEYHPGVVCEKPFDTMTIDWNGDVRICQFDAFGESNLGNVFQEGVLGAWNNAKMEEVRKRHKGNMIGKEEFCYGCEGKYLYNLQRKETEHYIINEGSNMVWYNHK